MFKKILIANRGEIACRVIRTCNRLGIATVAVYSDADRDARHARLADEAVRIGAARAVESYLSIDSVVAAAQRTGADAIHPGYGFLSESSEFARRCAQAGFIFIGPDPESMDAMASKSAAKALMEAAGVPVVPGYHGDEQHPHRLETEAQRLGFPLMIKATAGGGGKGMRLVEHFKQFRDALDGAKREARGAFGSDAVLLEKYIQAPRHIEFQVFGDQHGNLVHLYERECTLQRRFQKVLEETPSPFLDEATRKKMGEAAVAAARAVRYVNAGTIEFIVAADRSFHFMEMNTRLQVEHPITEATTGIDLVEWQLRVAAGETLPLTQDQIKPHGHAIEVRVYAENADNGFLPVTGRIEAFETPRDDFVRVDTGVRSGDEITIYYDPLVAKLTVTGEHRRAAIGKLQWMLARTAVFGLITNLPLLRSIARHPDFIAGRFDTGFIEHDLKTLLARPAATSSALASAVANALANADSGPWQRDGWQLGGIRGREFVVRVAEGDECRISVTGDPTCFALSIQGALHNGTATHTGGTTWQMMLDGRGYMADILRHGDDVQVAIDGDAHTFTFLMPYAPSSARVMDIASRIVSPMPGRVVAVRVKAGDNVQPGQPLVVLEGMKMEYAVKTMTAGVIEKVSCAEGQLVEVDTVLVDLKKGEV